MHEKEAEKARKLTAGVETRPPYWKIFKQAFPQLFNIFFVFFITLAVFPAVQSGKIIQRIPTSYSALVINRINQLIAPDRQFFLRYQAVG